MRKHLMLAVLITLINPPSGVASLQSAKDVAGNQSSSATSNLTSAEAQADFDLMRKALEEAHTGLYRFTTTAKLHPGVAEQPPGKYLFMGKVFVLIDGGTFSTAADFCAVTHHLKRATFIGEETGGGYYGNNSGMQTVVTLPNSKTQIRVPMYEY